MKRLLYYLIAMLPFNGMAQEFSWKADIKPVSSEDFYEIFLSPEFTCQLNPDFGDIRIKDAEGMDVPYLLYSEEPVLRTKLFHEYSVVEKTRKDRWGYTRLVVHNPGKTEITNFSLSIRNADVSKHLKLSGSDDNANWYAIKDNYFFHSIYSETGTSEIRIIDFPISNYEYYEILLYDFYNNPVDILKVGYYDYSREIGKYSNISIPTVSQKDSSLTKQTYVKIGFKNNEYIDKLTFSVEGAEFYYRQARLCRKVVRKIKKQEQVEFEIVENFYLSSNSRNSILLNSLRAEELYLVINNQDDKPLVIKSVTAQQLNHYLIAQLSPAKTYQLYYGDQFAKTPIYDLQFFKDSIPNGLTSLGVTNHQRVSKPIGEDHGNIEIEPVYLWLIIGFVVVLLGFMSVKMIKEMRQK